MIVFLNSINNDNDNNNSSNSNNNNNDNNNSNINDKNHKIMIVRVIIYSDKHIHTSYPHNQGSVLPLGPPAAQAHRGPCELDRPQELRQLQG